MNAEISSNTRFALQIASAMAADTASKTNAVMSNLVCKAYREHAKYMLVTQRIYDLVASDVMMSSRAYGKALYVSNYAAEQWLDDTYEGWREHSYPKFQ